MLRILRKKGLVRKVIAAETLGNTSIIATDKTRTLTEGKMKVVELFSLDKKGEDIILKTASLYTDPFAKDPTEKAMLIAATEAGFNREEIEEKEKKINEFPFDSVKKYGATLHRISKNKYRFYLMGAPEKLLEMADIKPGRLEKIDKKLKSLTQKGYRVVGIAYKDVWDAEGDILEALNGDKLLEKQIKDINFVGLAALKDPLRKDAKKAIRVCMEAGMKPIIVTGDHKLTAKSIASELGMNVKEENILEGKDLDALSDEEFLEKIEKIKVFARVEPAHKLRIIEAWQRKGEVIAMTGDGINDAPALKKADIGIAIGSGTEVAKETSDLILLNDSFSVIIAAIEEGRVILDNIRKVITWVNLIEDGLPGLSLAYEPKEKDIMKRKAKGLKSPLLTREMKVIIFIIGLITDVLLLGLYFWLRSHNYDIEHIRTMIFAGLTIDSLFYIFACKSLRRNIWQINIFSNKFLVVATLMGAVMIVLAVYAPVFQTLLKTVPLGVMDWSIILGLGILQLVLIEITKFYFIKKKLI